MSNEQQIQEALHASRVVPLARVNPHRPLGLEHLAEVVTRLSKRRTGIPPSGQIQRPVTLPVETWEKLDQLAHTATQAGTPPITASEIAAAIIQQGIQAR